MREDCRHFQSRTYDTGETARFCVLDLAPEAPWRCPEHCPRYEKDVVDASFLSGSLVRPPVEEEPPDDPAELRQVLSAAEAVVNAAAPEVAAELTRASKRRWWQPWKRRGDDGGGDFRLSNR